MPIFRIKSVKICTGQKNLHKYTHGSRDKYEVWQYIQFMIPQKYTYLTNKLLEAWGILIFWLVILETP